MDWAIALAWVRQDPEPATCCKWREDDPAIYLKETSLHFTFYNLALYCAKKKRSGIHLRNESSQSYKKGNTSPGSLWQIMFYFPIYKFVSMLCCITWNFGNYFWTLLNLRELWSLRKISFYIYGFLDKSFNL